VPWSIVLGAFFILTGLGAGWAGLMAPRQRAVAPEGDEPPVRHWSTTETRLSLVAGTMMGIGFVALGVSTWRYSKGSYIEVPASAPLIDHVIWALTFAGFIGGFAVMYAWAMVHSFEEKRARQNDADDSEARTG
jgi:hypothetical protein